MGWTNRSIANTILFVNEQQKRDLGGRVQALMDAQGLTNERLAYKAGVSSKTVSRVLNAKHELRLGTIEKLAAALDVTEQELRGPPPAPLGLGVEHPADTIDGRLDRIEETLKFQRVVNGNSDALDARFDRLERTLQELQVNQRALLGAIRELRSGLQQQAKERRPRAS